MQTPRTTLLTTLATLSLIIGSICTGLSVTPTQATYDVWGGNSLDLSKSYYNVNKLGYTKLGTTNRTATFHGRYNYYVVAVRPGQVLYLDAAETSAGTYYNNGSVAAGNVGGTANGIFGAPDRVYIVLNGGAAGGTSTYGSYAILYNTGGWSSMKFIVYEPQLAPAITAQPSRQIAPTGDTIRMKVAAIGVSPLSCQWHKNGTNLISGGRISGATTATLTLSGLRTEDEGSYSVTVRNIHGSITSSEALLTVAAPAQATYDVWGGNVLDFNKAYYEVDQLGYTKLGSTNRDAIFLGNYKYYVVVVRPGERLFLDAAQTSTGSYYGSGSLATGNIGTGIAGGAFGAPDGRYLLLDQPSTGYTPYTYGSYAIFYNTGGWSSMKFFVFSPDLLPSMAAQPVPQLLFVGSSARVKVETTGRAPLRHSWRKNGKTLLSGGRISGATSTNLAIANIQIADAGGYSVVVSNNYGSVTSALADLCVVVPPRSQTNTLGGTATFAACTAGGASLSYQWRKDGLDLTDDTRVTGTTTTNLVISNLQFADAGAYTVVITGDFGSATNPSPAMLKVTDRVAPFLEITSHTPFQLLATSSIILSGIASDAGRGLNGIGSVTVNGLRASNSVASADGIAEWSKPLTLLNGTNTIKVVAKDGAGNAATNIIRLACDTLKPVVKITSPATGQRVTNDTFTVKGRIVDKDGAAGVWCRLNSEQWIAATRVGSTNWTAQVPLIQSGTNTVQVCAVDTAGNRSLTNSVGFVYAEILTLAKYYPLPLGAEWYYEGLDWDGTPAKQLYRVQSTNHPLTLFAGQTSPKSYLTNCIHKYCAYLDSTTMVPYDEWDDYLAIEGTFIYWGSDDAAKSIRLDRGVRFPKEMAVGDTAAGSAGAYMNGRFAGSMTMKLTLLERVSITVPAGTFEDVLHVRLASVLPNESRVHDEWWAQGVGNIKAQGISGGGAPERWELIQHTLPPEPAP